MKKINQFITDSFALENPYLLRNILFMGFLYALFRDLFKGFMISIQLN